MTDFGERLRRERESRDVSLRELADATKIGKRYLEALEQNDFDALPGGVFAKGYIRNYAEYLGLDPEPLLEDYLRERRSRGEGDPAEDERAAQDAAQAVLTHLAASQGVSATGRSWIGWIAGGGLLVVVAAAVLTWALLLRPAPESGVGAAETPAEQTPPPPAETAAREVPAAGPSERRDEELESGEREERPEEREVAQAPAPEEPEPSPPARAEEPQPVAAQESGASREAQEVPPTRTAAAEPAGAGRLSVRDFGVGTGIVNRNLVGRGDRFPEGTVVWFWTRVLGGRPGDTIRHVWIREGRTQGTIELRVGASHWRTQSRWTMRPGSAGAWAVEARDAEGRLLARSEFTCVPAD